MTDNVERDDLLGWHLLRPSDDEGPATIVEFLVDGDVALVQEPVEGNYPDIVILSRDMLADLLTLVRDEYPTSNYKSVN